MAKLFITVGRVKQGAPLTKQLYLGADGDKAIAALQAAGRKGEIVSGEIYLDPQPWKKEDFYHLSEEAKAAAAEAKAKEEAAKANAIKEAANVAREELAQAIERAKATAEDAGQEFSLKEFLGQK